jgi:DNA-binding MarR family transcriptional regulator
MTAANDDLIVSAWVKLARGYTRVLAQVEDELKARALPELGWYDVLLELRRALPAKLRPMDLQDKLLLAQHNLSRLLERMEKAALIKRERFEEDRRGQLVGITPEGLDILKRIWPVYRNVLRQALGQKLSPRELEMIALALQKIERR